MSIVKEEIKHGDFTELANNYANYRPSYSLDVINFISAFMECPFSSANIADVGAGTGIFTKILKNQKPKQLFAVEPNKRMMEEGIKYIDDASVTWINASAESTGISTNSVNLVSMASSFHWPDFNKACAEFSRILKENGVFIALWNPRFISKDDYIHGEIEKYIYKLKPEMPRVSSGYSEFTDSLFERLNNSEFFHKTKFFESSHSQKRSVDEYIGVWNSVNDIQVQLGREKFSKLISFIKNLLSKEDFVVSKYKTRAWLANKK